MMVAWPPPNFAAVIRQAVVVMVIAVMVFASSLLPSGWHDLSPALAAPGGNGKGDNGNGNGNGGRTGVHKGNDSTAKNKKDKQNKDKKDKDSDESDADAGDDADQADASADQADAVSDAGQADAASDAGQADAAGDADQADAAGDADQADAASDADQADAAGDADQPASPATAKRAGGTPVAAAERSGRHDFVAGEVLVANIGDEIRVTVGRLGFAVLDERRLHSLRLTLTRLRVPRAMTAPAARRLLASRFAGIAVDLNAIYRPQGTLTLPPPDYPTKLVGWGPVPADCGRGLRIGLMDTAVDAAMPGLRGANIIQRSFLPATAAAASPEHGNAIAWILVGRHAGRAGGLLPSAELAVASVFVADPDGAPTADAVALVSGLDWLVGRGTPVVNMSFAGEPNAVVALALRRAIAGQVIVVAAAGNGGPTAAPPFPATEAGVIAVTAVDSHAQSYAEANRGSYISLAAPGVRIWTPGPTPTGSYQDGTSFAAPFVTADIALRLAGDRRPDAVRITKALARAARDLGPPGKDPVFGWGLLQSMSPCATLTQ